jgi:hypothetical protein
VTTQAPATVPKKRGDPAKQPTVIEIEDEDGDKDDDNDSDSADIQVLEAPAEAADAELSE